MNLLKDNIKNIYFRYLLTAFGSALITSIYSLVDMAVVGQYHGPQGSAALAVIAPIWNIIYSLGLLMGIGGSVLFSHIKGLDKNNIKQSNEYFTISLIASICISLFLWFIIILFEKELLLFFGAQASLLSLSQRYLIPIKYVIPFFLFNQMLAAFLRNDNNPTLATLSVLCGGFINVIGDYLLVFTFDMGILGAGIATALGSTISFVIMLSHFFFKKCTLSIVKPTHTLQKLKKIIYTGFSTFFIDIAMGILTILFNRQIMKYLGADALSIYGLIVNISTFVQCCAYSVGQAAQPIISINLGAKSYSRIKETLKYALYTTVFFSFFWTLLSWLFPNLYIYFFMKPTKTILKIAPTIIRTYSLSFLLLPINIFATYYFQALMKSKASFIISVLRSCVLSGLLITILPLIFTPQSIWFTMPVCELIVAFYSITRMIKYTHSFYS